MKQLHEKRDNPGGGVADIKGVCYVCRGRGRGPAVTRPWDRWHHSAGGVMGGGFADIEGVCCVCRVKRPVVTRLWDRWHHSG